MLRYIRFYRFVILCICIVFGGCLQAFAGDVSLAWDPSPSEGVVGYKVHYGSSPGSYDSFRTVTDQTSYPVTDLSDGTYYFAVTALDSAGNESGYSNEVSAVVSGSVKSCDINNDSAVNVIDMQGIVNMILQGSPFQSEFDLYTDGVINVLDLQILNNVVLGLRSCP